MEKRAERVKKKGKKEGIEERQKSSPMSLMAHTRSSPTEMNT